RNGVYITKTNGVWNSITNIGIRPTFGGGELSIETFLLDKFEGKTPERIWIEFLRRIRDEKKFESAEALKGQILRDAGRAKTFFRRTANLRKHLD
ncbi:MAG: riboflavin kinase, partial [Bryobacteraceae bacterium]